jgi:Fe-S cluster assembly protein SufD
LKITFINGVFSEEHSSLGHNQEAIKVLNLKQALKDCPELLDQHFGKYVNIEVDGVIASNAALNEDGSVIFIGENTTANQPIIINTIFDTNLSDIASFGHHLVVVGENSEAKIVEISTTIGEKSSFNNTLTELIVGKSSRVDYYKIQNENDASYHLGTTQVIQKDNSYFYSATITVNGGFVRNNLNLVLDGQHIDNHMYGLYIPNGSQFVDNHTIVDHKLPNCQSNELYKGVLMDKSTGVFNGKIFVREDAQKTNAYQNCRNVITSDSATMNSKPQLEIWADDVKCSHGTTTGKLNDEAIFYMQSRGIPKAEAVKLQLIAFAEDVVSQIKIEEIKEILEGLIEAKLS